MADHYFMAVVALFVAAGCDTHGAFCEDWASCELKDTHQQEICEINQDLTDDRADVMGCSDTRDDYVDCMQDNAACDNATFDAPDLCRLLSD